MPMIQSHEDHLRVDVDYISLKDCFEAFRRGVEHHANDSEPRRPPSC
nr:MAG TPA: hypothetical protein [Caudoviricetes sp.]